MIGMESVPARDWAALAVGVFGIIIARLQSRDRLPKWVRRWLSRLGEDRIEQAIEYAAKIGNLSPEERRREAASYLARIAEQELGLRIPQSIANLLIEYAYQYWKRR